MTAATLLTASLLVWIGATLWDRARKRRQLEAWRAGFDVGYEAAVELVRWAREQGRDTLPRAHVTLPRAHVEHQREVAPWQ